MDFSFERIIRTVSSEQYGVYTDENEIYALVDIHYGRRVDVGILLLMEESEGIDEERVSKLMYELEGDVILSYSEEIEEIIHTVSVGKLEAEYTNEFDD